MARKASMTASGTTEGCALLLPGVRCRTVKRSHTLRASGTVSKVSLTRRMSWGRRSPAIFRKPRTVAVARRAGSRVASYSHWGASSAHHRASQNLLHNSASSGPALWRARTSPASVRGSSRGWVGAAVGSGAAAAAGAALAAAACLVGPAAVVGAALPRWFEPSTGGAGRRDGRHADPLAPEAAREPMRRMWSWAKPGWGRGRLHTGASAGS